jgi:hypothetical protein
MLENLYIKTQRKQPAKNIVRIAHPGGPVTLVRHFIRRRCVGAFRRLRQIKSGADMRSPFSVSVVKKFIDIYKNHPVRRMRIDFPLRYICTLDNIEDCLFIVPTMQHY